MFVKRVFGSFAILLAILTVPFMYYRYYNHKDPYIPTSVIVNYFATYDEWDSLVSTLNDITTTTDNLERFTNIFDDIWNQSVFETLSEIGDLILHVFYPIIGIIEIGVAFIDFLVGNITWIFGLFDVIRQY